MKFSNLFSKNLLYVLIVPPIVGVFLIIVSFSTQSAFAGASFSTLWFIRITSLLTIFFFGYHFLKYKKARNLVSLNDYELLRNLNRQMIDVFSVNHHGIVADLCCANADLSVTLCEEFPEIMIDAFDYWSANSIYDYKNAVMNVKGCPNIHLIKKDIAHLDCEDEIYDGIVAKFLNYDIKGDRNIETLMGEAFRVIKKGSSFVFLDQFFNKDYSEKDANFYLMTQNLTTFGIILLKDNEVIPKYLFDKKLLSGLAIIYGVK